MSSPAVWPAAASRQRPPPSRTARRHRIGEAHDPCVRECGPLCEEPDGATRVGRRRVLCDLRTGGGGLPSRAFGPRRAWRQRVGGENGVRRLRPAGVRGGATRLLLGPYRVVCCRAPDGRHSHGRGVRQRPDLHRRRVRRDGGEHLTELNPHGHAVDVCELLDPGTDRVVGERPKHVGLGGVQQHGHGVERLTQVAPAVGVAVDGRTHEVRPPGQGTEGEFPRGVRDAQVGQRVRQQHGLDQGCGPGPPALPVQHRASDPGIRNLSAGGENDRATLGHLIVAQVGDARAEHHVVHQVRLPSLLGLDVDRGTLPGDPQLPRSWGEAHQVLQPAAGGLADHLVELDHHWIVPLGHHGPGVGGHALDGRRGEIGRAAWRVLDDGARREQRR